MADLQREKDERVEKTPTSESNQGNLRRDDDSKVEEKNRGTANTGRQDSNLGKTSTGVGSQGSAGQTPEKDEGIDKGMNKPGMNR